VERVRRVFGGFKISKPGSIAPRPRQGCHKARAHGIVDAHKHDWNGAGRLQLRAKSRTANGQNDVRSEGDRFSCLCAAAVGIGSRNPIVDPDLATGGPAQRLQSKNQSRNASGQRRIIGPFEQVCCFSGGAWSTLPAVHNLLQSRMQFHDAYGLLKGRVPGAVKGLGGECLGSECASSSSC
jgi:hypothetical protein